MEFHRREGNRDDEKCKNVENNQRIILNFVLNYWGFHEKGTNSYLSPDSSEPDFSDVWVELVRASLGLSPVLGSDCELEMTDFIKTSNAS